jgi:NAD(P)-dependent dehydrogenase (short-subunit alcohol dehydrogenase family)
VGRLEVAGAPLRFMHDSHWKMFVENLNDTMHPMVAHEFSAGTARDPWREQPPDEEIIPAASAKMAAAAKQVPVGRFGKPHDVARAVAFFSDPKASFVTGQTLFVCGGTSVGSIVY